MSQSDIIATSGVSLLFTVYFLNRGKYICTENKWLNGLNVADELLCCHSVWSMISFCPLPMPEDILTIAASAPFVKRVPRETIIN